MDDSTTPIGNTTGGSTDSHTSFGMPSFGINEREKFGQSLRLAMACIEEQPVSTMA